MAGEVVKGGKLYVEEEGHYNGTAVEGREGGGGGRG